MDSMYLYNWHPVYDTNEYGKRNANYTHSLKFIDHTTNKTHTSRQPKNQNDMKLLRNYFDQTEKKRSIEPHF